jgi:hypothetical protein
MLGMRGSESQRSFGVPEILRSDTEVSVWFLVVVEISLFQLVNRESNRFLVAHLIAVGVISQIVE